MEQLLVICLFIVGIMWKGKIVGNYEFSKVIGVGSFSKCYKVRDITTNDYFACKRVENIADYESEIKILRELNHDNIVPFFCGFIDKLVGYIVMELCSNGSLQVLMDNRANLTYSETRYFTNMIGSGLRYLHDHLIVHRDIKLANILLTSNMQPKIADFGFATKLTGRNEQLECICGTKNYLAPEVVDGQSSGLPVDIWGFGCVIYYLMVGHEPFSDKNHKVSEYRIRLGTYHKSSKLKKSANLFLKFIFEVDPEKRPTIEVVLAHTFLKTSGTPRTLFDKQLFKDYKKGKNNLRSIDGAEIKNTPEGKENRGHCKTEMAKIKHEHRMTLRPRNNVESQRSQTICPAVKNTKFRIFHDKESSSQTHLQHLIDHLACLVNHRNILKFQKKELPSGLLCVTRWVQILPKGLIYQLSDGSISYSETEPCRFYLHRRYGGQFRFMSDGFTNTFTQDNIPQPIEQLVETFNVGRKQLLHLSQSGPHIPSNSEVYFVKKWEIFKNPAAIAMMLCDGTFQVNFASHEKYIVNYKADLLAIITEEGADTYSLRMAKSSGVPGINSKLMNYLKRHQM